MFQAGKDNDKSIFQKMKMFIDADFDGLELEQVDSHFVDTSGFGKKGEPALIADEFLEKVKAGRFYAITGIGQFQVRIGEYVEKSCLVWFYHIFADDVDDYAETGTDAMKKFMVLLDAGYERIRLYSVYGEKNTCVDHEENCLLAIGDMPY